MDWIGHIQEDVRRGHPEPNRSHMQYFVTLWGRQTLSRNELRGKWNKQYRDGGRLELWFLKKVFNRNKEELQMTEKGYLCADVLLKPIIWFSVFFANKRFDRISNSRWWLEQIWGCVLFFSEIIWFLSSCWVSVRVIRKSTLCFTRQ